MYSGETERAIHSFKRTQSNNVSAPASGWREQNPTA